MNQPSLLTFNYHWDTLRQTIPVQFSAGWTNYIPGESPEELLQRADKALYANKRAAKEQNELDILVE